MNIDKKGSARCLLFLCMVDFSSEKRGFAFLYKGHYTIILLSNLHCKVRNVPKYDLPSKMPHHAYFLSVSNFSYRWSGSEI